MSHLESYLRSQHAHKGWPFECGPAELFHFQDTLFVPNGKVLDVGSGDGVASLQFALKGMNVTCIDIDLEKLRSFQNAIREARTLSSNVPYIESILHDAKYFKFEEQKYDLMIFSQFPIHFESREEALNLFKRAIKGLKVGGHLFINIVTKLDSNYDELRNNPYLNNCPKVIDNDVIEILCNCSGKQKREPVLFFNHEDLLLASQENMRLIYSRHIQNEIGEGPNIMYGEDIIDPFYKQFGYSTIIAQKG